MAELPNIYPHWLASACPHTNYISTHHTSHTDARSHPPQSQPYLILTLTVVPFAHTNDTQTMLQSVNTTARVSWFGAHKSRSNLCDRNIVFQFKTAYGECWSVDALPFNNTGLWSMRIPRQEAFYTIYWSAAGECQPVGKCGRTNRKLTGGPFWFGEVFSRGELQIYTRYLQNVLIM